MEELNDREKQMNEEILLLREEFSECWWSHNGWKYKDKDKFEKFSMVKETFINMPISMRNNHPSSQILECYFIACRKAVNESNSNS